MGHNWLEYFPSNPLLKQAFFETLKSKQSHWKKTSGQSHTVQEIFDNEYAEIRLDIRKKPMSREYDLRANMLGPIYKCIDCVVAKYHMMYLKILQIPMNVEAYIQSIVLKKIVETVSLDRRKWLEASLSVIEGPEIHEQPTSRNYSRTESTKNTFPHYLRWPNHSKRPEKNHK
ncbi:hypothetical protein CWI38_0558p0020 [Hamiltosporidium tvaerminnensis]|uniref:Uncharacterized protein n=1 Tax=Hamiltosporidium tvaerminnensis TaxID=1176355 RepID=A0A4Q9LWA6_9MICR|nr:hypothetical protein CWI38_0558p0020 [Hamiltosporidium tvaerminnensis]